MKTLVLVSQSRCPCCCDWQCSNIGDRKAWARHKPTVEGQGRCASHALDTVAPRRRFAGGPTSPTSARQRNVAVLTYSPSPGWRYTWEGYLLAAGIWRRLLQQSESSSAPVATSRHHCSAPHFVLRDCRRGDAADWFRQGLAWGFRSRPRRRRGDRSERFTWVRIVLTFRAERSDFERHTRLACSLRSCSSEQHRILLRYLLLRISQKTSRTVPPAVMAVTVCCSIEHVYFCESIIRSLWRLIRQFSNYTFKKKNLTRNTWSKY